MIRVCSVSADMRFHMLCAEALDAVAEIEILRAASMSEAAAADLYVRDFDLREPPAAGDFSGAETVFVARREDLAALHTQLRGEAVAVLVKPADLPGMRQFLEAAVARCRSRLQEKADPRRFERDQFLECLLLAGLKLQQFGAQRSNFLARALHDLWAPLTAADGYCTMLLQDVVDRLSPEQADTLRRLHGNVRRLLRTTSFVYQLGSGVSERELPSIGPANIAVCVDNAVNGVAPFARERGIEIRTSVRQPAEPMYFDAGGIETVLDYLLENACRFTPRFTTVELEAFPVVWSVRRFRLQSADGNWFVPVPASGGPNAYRVDVRDSGAPVSESDLAGMFDQYSPRYSHNGRSGAGLALAACRLIVEAHCGELVVKPQPEGAVFSFVLPMIKPELDNNSHMLQEQVIEGRQAL